MVYFAPESLVYFAPESVVYYSPEYSIDYISDSLLCLMKYSDNSSKLCYIGTLLINNQEKEFLLDYPNILPYFRKHFCCCDEYRLVLGLDFEIAKQIKKNCLNNTFDFSEVIKATQEIFIKENSKYGNSNDGTVVCSLENFIKIREIEF